MERSNDNQRQTTEQLRQTVAQLSLRVNQLERLLSGLEINEARVDGGVLQYRMTKFGFAGGSVRQDWRDVNTLSLNDLSVNKNITLGGTIIIIGGTGATISLDYVWVGKNRLAIPVRTTDYLKVYLNGTTTPEWVDEMPTEQDEDAQVYDVTKWQIHLPGNFG
jgi:hypothetical protein